MKTTKYALVAALGLLALVVPGAVRADTIFTVTGCTLCNGTTNDTLLSGTMTINTTTGVIDSANLTTTGALVLGPFNVIDSQAVTGTTPGYYFARIDDSTSYPFDQMFISFPTTTLVSYQGGHLCSFFNPSFACPATPDIEGTVIITISSGSFQTSDVLLTAVPDPPTIALLGTGLLGLVGAVRRKWLA